MTTAHHGETISRLAPRVFEVYIRFASAILILTGAALWFCIFDDLKALDSVDPILRLTNRTLLAISGGVHFTIGVYLAMGSDLTMKGFIMLWIGWTYLTFHFFIRLWGSISEPLPVAVLISWELGISPKALYAIWELVFGYLALGGAMVLIFGRMEEKKLKSEQLISQWRTMRQRTYKLSGIRKKESENPFEIDSEE